VSVAITTLELVNVYRTWFAHRTTKGHFAFYVMLAAVRMSTGRAYKFLHLRAADGDTVGIKLRGFGPNNVS
jgi:hypothetical protein